MDQKLFKHSPRTLSIRTFNNDYFEFRRRQNNRLIIVHLNIFFMTEIYNKIQNLISHL